jgi:hypothetical protein
MKQHMRRVRDNSVVQRQEGVRVAEYDPDNDGSAPAPLEQIWYPPSTNLADEEYAKTNPQPVVEPMRIGSGEVQ